MYVLSCPEVYNDLITLAKQYGDWKRVPRNAIPKGTPMGLFYYDVVVEDGETIECISFDALNATIEYLDVKYNYERRLKVLPVVPSVDVINDRFYRWKGSNEKVLSKGRSPVVHRSPRPSNGSTMASSGTGVNRTKDNNAAVKRRGDLRSKQSDNSQKTKRVSRAKRNRG